jgi:hypothetical protein
VDSINSFVREDYKTTDHKTIVTLKSLTALSALAKKYYTTMEGLARDEAAIN